MADPSPSHGALGAPSPWVMRWLPLLAPGARVLDVACGSGRHVRVLVAAGMQVTALDRDGAAMAPLRGMARLVEADIEGGPWPLAGERFDAVIVTHYLWRPLMTAIMDSVSDGGLLVYETFALGNETVGRPARPDFLLKPGELLDATAGWRVVAYEDGFLDSPPRYLQRIAAVRPGADTGPPRRWPL